MDQRALFFFVAAVISGALIPVIDNELRYVPQAVAIVYVLLAAASYFDWRTNKR